MSRVTGIRGTRVTLLATALLASTAFLFAGLAGASGAVYVVNSTADAIDVNPADSVCATSAGTCTLRAAVMQANSLPGADTIQLPGGTYAIAIPSAGQDSAASGDLDITESVMILGAGAGSTVIDAGDPPSGSSAQRRGLDRLFEVVAASGTVRFSGLTLSDGYAAEYGGAILNSSMATVVVTDSVLRGNTAGKHGGAIDNHAGGRVEVRNSTLFENYAVEGGSAVNNNRDGLMEIISSVVRTNSAAVVGLDPNLAGGGAIGNNAELDADGTIVLVDSQVLENRAGGGRGGAGVSNDGTGRIVVQGTTFSKNVADGNGGGLYNGSGDVTVASSTFSENLAKGGAGIASSGNLIVSDSLLTKNTAEDWGGGVLNLNVGAVTMRWTTFTENGALAGGGFANEGSGLVSVESSTFTKNRAMAGALSEAGEGGGMHSNSGGEVLISGGRFSDNVAHDGGGFSNEGGGRVVITGTLFSANVADQSGGGILVEGGDVRMVGIDVVGNLSKSIDEGGGGISYAGDKSVGLGESAAIEGSRIRDNKTDGQGGGIDSRGDGPLAIVATSITGNTAVIGGGLHHVGDATLLLARSTLSGNLARDGAGAFTDGDGEATIENTTISANRAADFGGGVLVSSRLTVRHSTVTKNLAASGGGVNNGGGALIGDGFVFLANSIVSNNPAGGNCAGTITSRGGNVENTNSCQLRELTDHPGTDPLLGPLADNGGPTLTHALLAGSPAQDAAVCTDSDECPEADQRGVARPQFAGFDVGAVESELAPDGGGTQVCAGRTERPVQADYDSWISQSSSNGNFGTDAILKSSGSARALVHFGLPPIPPGCRLVDATLRLYAPSATPGRTLEALRVASSWTELGITWSNQPATTGAAATTPSGFGQLEWDVLDQALDMYAAGAAHGFLVRDAATGGGEQSFHSREKLTDTPELVLVFDDPDAPPPTGVCATVPQLISADRDSWVSQGSPSNNFGGDSTLKLNSQSGNNARVLVRFPLPPLGAGCTSVSSAVLRIHASSAREGRTLQALQAAGGWTESGVTWNIQPDVTGPAAAASSALGVIEWDVTDQVLGMYTAENNGFVIRDAAENGPGDEQSLNSREKGSGVPELVFAFDDSTPETTILLAPESLTRSTEATFGFSSDRDDASFECSLDGAAFGACSTPFTITGVADGEHVLQVRATRPVRAIDPTPESYGWTVDATEPQTTIDAAPADPTNSTSARFTFSADETATFECSLDDEEFIACSSPLEYDLLAQGSHALRVRATDVAGNVETGPAVHGWTIDVTPPTTTIDSGPPNPTNSTSATFTFEADETATFQCSLDSGDFTACESPADYADLADGSHTLLVRGTDVAGNVQTAYAGHTWTVDTIAPEATIDTRPADPTNGTTASLSFSADEAATFACALDAAEYAACQSPVEYTDLAEGDHSLRIQATDAAGNTGAAAVYTWTIDLTPPQATIDSGPADPTNSTSASLTFSADESATFACALDAAVLAPCVSHLEYSDLGEGNHSLDVQATDAAGNTGAVVSYTWTIDLTPPQATVDSGPADPTNTTTAILSFSADEAATFACALDAAEFAACESPAEYADLTEGDHTLRVQATDAAGNTGAAVSYTWTIDVTAPEATIDSGPTDPTNSTSAPFTFSANEAATFACALDAAEFAACESPAGYADLAQGSHTFRVQATDHAGNTGAAVVYTWTIDAEQPPGDETPPETTIDSGPADLTNATAASFTFSADEAGSTFECSLDSVAFSTCASPRVYTGLAEGSHTFRVRATDAAGNLDPTAAAHAWSVDTTPPQTSIESGPANPTAATGATFTFSSNESNATFACSLDGTAFAACASPLSYSSLADGSHTFRVQSTDAPGNVDPTPASQTWTVDSSAPQTTIIAAPVNPTSSMSASFSFTSSEAGSSFECSLDATAFAACTSPSAYTGLAAGSHTFRVRATDAVGNVDETPASHTWTIDTTAPQTTITAAPSSPTTSPSASFSFTSSESGSTFECSLDTAAFAACASPASNTGLAAGSHTFRVRAIDSAGNVDPTPATHSWTIELVSGCGSPVTVTASADAWIEQNSPTNNKGTDSILKVKAQGASDHFRALVRFSLPGNLPSGCTVQSATLRLYAPSASTGRTIQALVLAGAWTENGVTWANQPQTTGTAATTGSGTGWREWSVTSLVQAMYGGTANHGFLIRDAVEGGSGAEQQFHAREKGENSPQLVITFGPSN